MDFNGSTVRKIELYEATYILLGFYNERGCWGSVLLERRSNGTTTFYPQLIFKNIREFSTDDDYYDAKELYQGQLNELTRKILDRFGKAETTKPEKPEPGSSRDAFFEYYHAAIAQDIYYSLEELAKDIGLSPGRTRFLHGKYADEHGLPKHRRKT